MTPEKLLQVVQQELGLLLGDLVNKAMSVGEVVVIITSPAGEMKGVILSVDVTIDVLKKGPYFEKKENILAILEARDNSRGKILVFHPTMVALYHVDEEGARGVN